MIGVAADVRNSGLAANQKPEYYVLRKKITDPNAGRDANIMSRAVHFYDGQGSVIVRSVASPQVVANEIRREVSALDSYAPVAASTLASRVASIQQRPRFSAFLVGGFALIGLILASVGLYGLVSFVVAQRSAEIGVRMAVGATPGHIRRFVLDYAARWTISGLIIGLLVALFAARWLQTLLFEVGPHDPKALVGAGFILVAVTMGAALIPSGRAARVDPVATLRSD